MTSPIDTDEQTFVLNEDVVESGNFPILDGTDSGGLPIGTIRMFAGDISSIADEEQLAQGQILSISQQAALFSLLGTTYGGSGITTFDLPNLAGTVMVDTGESLGADGPFGDGVDLGETYGQDSVTLSEANMPATIGGQDQPYSNDQPSLGVNYLINIGGSGTGVDVPGMVVPFLGDFAPAGYVLAQGQILQITQNEALYARIGNAYGGSVSAGTFALPISRAAPSSAPTTRTETRISDRVAWYRKRLRHDHTHPAGSAVSHWVRSIHRQPAADAGAVLHHRRGCAWQRFLPDVGSARRQHTLSRRDHGLCGEGLDYSNRLGGGGRTDACRQCEYTSVC